MNNFVMPDRFQILPKGATGLACLFGFLILSGCSGSKDAGEIPPPDPETSRSIHMGRIVYQQHCTNCHDTTGDGRAFLRGSNLRKNAEQMTFESIRQITAEGKGEMPGYQGELTEKQIAAVSNYILLELFQK
jgi:mono/diheme cytochrome c family protein